MLRFFFFGDGEYGTIVCVLRSSFLRLCSSTFNFATAILDIGDTNRMLYPNLVRAVQIKDAEIRHSKGEKLSYEDSIPELIGVSRNIMAVGWKGTGS